MSAPSKRLGFCLHLPDTDPKATDEPCSKSEVSYGNSYHVLTLDAQE